MDWFKVLCVLLVAASVALTAQNDVVGEIRVDGQQPKTHNRLLRKSNKHHRHGEARQTVATGFGFFLNALSVVSGFATIFDFVYNKVVPDKKQDEILSHVKDIKHIVQETEEQVEKLVENQQTKSSHDHQPQPIILETRGRYCCEEVDEATHDEPRPVYDDQGPSKRMTVMMRDDEVRYVPLTRRSTPPSPPVFYGPRHVTLSKRGKSTAVITNEKDYLKVADDVNVSSLNKIR
jgi:hypothetical protein